MTNIQYQIDYTDSSVKKTPIVIPANQIDESTALKMHGYGSIKYGESIWENMVHLMENFCSWKTAPRNPTEGQLWYRASDKQLLLYTKDNSDKFYWKNVIPGTGFDATGGNTNALDMPATVGFVQTELSKCLTISSGSNNQTVTAPVYLNPSIYPSVIFDAKDGKFTISNGFNPQNTEYASLSNIAASIFYVDTKVRTAIDNKVNELKPVDSSGTTVSGIILAATNMNNNSPWIKKDGSDMDRTMYGPLLLRTQSSSENTSSTPSDNEAVSKKYISELLKGNAYTLNYTNVLSIVQTNANLKEFPFLLKSGDTATDHIILPATEFNTPDNAAVTKKYVDDALNKSVIPSQLGKDINTSYTKTPDGTTIVYGHGFELLGETNSQNWYSATITLPSTFSNNWYSVTITENIPTTISKIYPQPQILKNEEGSLEKVMWPLSFKVYNQTPSAFDVCVFVPSGLDPIYKKSISFNFIAIGR